MNKKPIIRKKYIGTTDPKELAISTRLYNYKKRKVQIRKRRHRLEEFETIFNEAELDFDPDDDRFDAVSDISSEDDPMYD